MNVMDFLICIYQQMHRIGAGFNWLPSFHFVIWDDQTEWESAVLQFFINGVTTAVYLLLGKKTRFRFNYDKI
jgi:hypothetical protein